MAASGAESVSPLLISRRTTLNRSCGKVMRFEFDKCQSEMDGFDKVSIC